MEAITDKEWLSIRHMQGTASSASLSLSLSFAPWDAGRQEVVMSSPISRTEPTTRWSPPDGLRSIGRFDVSEILQQAGVGPSYSNMTKQERRILKLDYPKKNKSVNVSVRDRTPERQRAFIQTDPSNIGAGFSGANVLLLSNWSILLAGDTLSNILMDFTYTTANVFAADPAYSRIFTSALEQSNVAHALSTVLTSLSSTAYENQMLAFDHFEQVQEVFFDMGLVQSSSRGYIAFVTTIAVHLVGTCIIAVLFCFNTKISLLGEAWASIAPLIANASNNSAKSTPMMHNNESEVWEC